MKCSCVWWSENIDKLEAPRLQQHARNPGSADYTGVKFRFCPWCAKQLVEDSPSPTPGATNG